MSEREHHLVELVDEDGRAIGACTVAEAHQAPGRLHRAFSVILMDHYGRILLQQRAAAKTRFALRWANACCGHPAPGQSPVEAANRRLAEELGIGPVTLTEIGTFRYVAGDPATGRVESEYDHVLLAGFDSTTPLAPDPAEVAALRWASRDELRADMRARPDAYAPWLAGVLTQLDHARDVDAIVGLRG